MGVKPEIAITSVPDSILKLAHDSIYYPIFAFTIQLCVVIE